LLELGFVVAGAKLDGLEGLALGWTLAVSIEGACVGLVWIFATKRGLAAAEREFTAPPPLEI
jgi:hypothetical protein